MNRYARAATAALLLAGGLGSVGCVHSGMTPGDRLRNAYDGQWPDRYNLAARQATLAPFAQQAANGHVLDQTLWNWYFEPGTDRLNAAGLDRLTLLARGSDPKIYIQFPNDLQVTPDNIDKIGPMREDLAAKRAVAARKFLATEMGGPGGYEFAMHNAPTPGIYAPFPVNAFRTQTRFYVGGLITQGGGPGAQLQGNVTGASGASVSGGAAAGVGGGSAGGGTGGGGTGGVGP